MKCSGVPVHVAATWCPCMCRFAVLVCCLCVLAMCAPPPCSRTVVTTGVLSESNTTLATAEAGEPTSAFGPNSSGKSVWFAWHHVVDVTAIAISLAGSTFDTLLGVYVDTNGTLAGLELVGSVHTCGDYCVLSLRSRQNEGCLCISLPPSPAPPPPNTPPPLPHTTCCGCAVGFSVGGFG